MGSQFSIEKLRENDPTITEVTQFKAPLFGNFATTEEIKQVCEALHNNTHVVKLDIGIDDDESLQQLSTLLANNKVIKQLILGLGYGITEKSVEFWEQIKKSTTLSELFVTDYNYKYGDNYYILISNALIHNFSITNGYLEVFQICIVIDHF